MNNTNDTLKPCPFCGTTWTGLDLREYGLDWTVSCDNCHAYGPSVNGEQDAMDAWNERITQQNFGSVE